MRRTKRYKLLWIAAIGSAVMFVLVWAVAMEIWKPSEPEESVDVYLEYVPEGAEERICYGKSAMGRELLAYRFGSGENVLVMTFCIHGFEDHFNRDGAALVYTANRLMEEIPGWDCDEWSIYVLPCCNPDGLLDGSSSEGAGRCTMAVYGENKELLFGTGADINRCFPVCWRAMSERRYFNGSVPLACTEAASLAKFVSDVKGERMNFCIDTHGWYQQILTSAGKNCTLYKVFSSQFPENSWADLNKGEGYFSAYAALLGYEACLFEFPSDIESMGDFRESGYCEDYIEAVRTLVSG